MRMIVTAPGSMGDVNPLLAVARGLLRQGHEVLFLAAERYLPLAQRAGLETSSLVSEADFCSMTADPRVWHPRHGPRLLLGHMLEDYLEQHYAWLEENCDPSQCMLVSHVLDFAGRIYREAHPEIKLVHVLPAPALLRSIETPPRITGHAWERWLPGRLMPLVYRAADYWLDGLIASRINQLRRRVGLADVRRLLQTWWWSPDLVLCMFPAWYSVAAADHLPQMHCVGFPLADSADLLDEPANAAIAELLAWAEYTKPIVFAPGTAHCHAAGFLSSATVACERLGQAGLLISSDPTQFPKCLPESIRLAQYMPFSRLLPLAGAIAHHGGVGTTSQALAAGIPQLVLPMAYDQFDNAERVQRLACGTWFPMRNQSPARLTRGLGKLKEYSSSAALVAQQLQPPSQTIETVIDLIRRLIG